MQTIIDLEDKLMLREGWLSERYRDEGDVMSDEDGEEYVYSQGDALSANSERGEKIYLPNQLQTLNFPF